MHLDRSRSVSIAVDGERFRSELLNHGRSQLTVDTYEHRLRWFGEWLAAVEIAVEDVTVDSVEQWITDQRVAQKLSAKTIQCNVGAVTSFYTWLESRGLIAKDPLRGLWPIKVPKKLPRILQVSEVEALIAAASTRRARALAEFFYACGVRISELIGCNVDDLDLAGPQALIRGKGDKERYIPITAVAVRAVRDWLEERGAEIAAWENLRTRAAELRRRGLTFQQIAHEMGVSAPVALKYVAQSKSGFKDRAALFIGRQGRLKEGQIRGILKQVAKDAGILKRVYPHLLRHSMATHLREGGAELEVIQELLGHESIETTRRYVHVARERIRQVYERAHPRAGGSNESPTDRLRPERNGSHPLPA